jgi:hypothetical protein
MVKKQREMKNTVNVVANILFILSIIFVAVALFLDDILNAILFIGYAIIFKLIAIENKEK